MGKKKPEVLKAQREKFVKGAEANGITEAISNQVFDLIDYFSGYGFNKSHSAAYALIAYQTAWLKTHYPKEFLAALLSNTTDQDKIAAIINECRRLNIKILPPHINKSGREFMLDGDAIRFGLGAIKGLGGAVIRQILSCRPFKDAYDLAYKGLNKAAIETLAFSGCLPFGTRRAVTLAIPAILKAPSIVGREEQTLFGTGDAMLPEIENLPEFPLDELLRLEKEYLGFYVSAHPLDRYKLPPHKDISAVDEGNFTVAGIVTKTKTGYKTKHWAALTIEDYTGTLEVLVFDKKPINIKIGMPYVFQGRVQDEEGKRKLFARQYRPVA